MIQLRVLVADDEPSNAQIAEIILASAGHSVTCCRNGAEVLELCLTRGERYDLVLMDILMPEVDGLEATRILRSHPMTKDMPILCLSARASGSDRRIGLDAGCTHYISKPIKRPQLLAEIHRTLVRVGRILPTDSIVAD